MDLISNIFPTLYKIMQKKPTCAINLTSLENELTIGILTGKRKKVFKGNDANTLKTQLEAFLAA